MTKAPLMMETYFTAPVASYMTRHVPLFCPALPISIEVVALEDEVVIWKGTVGVLVPIPTFPELMINLCVVVIPKMSFG